MHSDARRSPAGEGRLSNRFDSRQWRQGGTATLFIAWKEEDVLTAEREGRVCVRSTRSSTRSSSVTACTCAVEAAGREKERGVPGRAGCYSEREDCAQKTEALLAEGCRRPSTAMCALIFYALRICKELAAAWMPLAGVVWMALPLAGGCIPLTASAAAAARMR
jgi:hypothetical protein